MPCYLVWLHDDALYCKHDAEVISFLLQSSIQIKKIMYTEAKQPIWKAGKKKICLKIKSVVEEKNNYTNQNENAEAQVI